MKDLLKYLEVSFEILHLPTGEPLYVSATVTSLKDLIGCNIYTLAEAEDRGVPVHIEHKIGFTCRTITLRSYISSSRTVEDIKTSIEEIIWTNIDRCNIIYDGFEFKNNSHYKIKRHELEILWKSIVPLENMYEQQV